MNATEFQDWISLLLSLLPWIVGASIWGGIMFFLFVKFAQEITK